MFVYSDLGQSLRESYDRKVDEREAADLAPWKSRLRQRFLERLLQEGKTDLLEVGAGTGQHGSFFKHAGLNVVATDLSGAMVEACRAKGLQAWQMDFLSLDFDDASFDAVFSLNCFLHVPSVDLPSVLTATRRLLREDGLLYWGQYGGSSYQGYPQDDHYVPKRFFSYLSDEQMREFGLASFEPVEFEKIEVDANWDQHFQSTTWRR